MYRYDDNPDWPEFPEDGKDTYIGGRIFLVSVAISAIVIALAIMYLT